MPEDVKALKEANEALQKQVDEQAANMARLSDMLLMREAGDFVSVELAKVQLPEVTKARLQQQLAKAAPFKEGRLDITAFAVQIAEAVKAEQVYLAEAGVGAGRITGFGRAAMADVKPEQYEAELADSFRRMGLGDAAAKQAAKGRGDGGLSNG